MKLRSRRYIRSNTFILEIFFQIIFCCQNHIDMSFMYRVICTLCVQNAYFIIFFYIKIKKVMDFVSDCYFFNSNFTNIYYNNYFLFLQLFIQLRGYIFKNGLQSYSYYFYYFYVHCYLNFPFFILIT